MGVTKTENFTKSQNQLATLAKALGHPARVAILEKLLKIDRCICGDLVSELPLSQATVSQHLRALKDVGLIKGNIEGTSVCYCIDRDKWRETQSLLNAMFDTFNQSSCC
ncbi:MAG: metalloregulator ArsR/SmtB family transcription factor [Cyclobacteriaceae bacterium]|nr:metalloregulator ArsR/SmtB family transcription factor [Cyclobacteriaceae bacterium]